MEVISLPGLPCFPPAGIGQPVEQRLNRLATLGKLPRPLIAGYESQNADIVRALLTPLAEPLAAHVPRHLRTPEFKQRSTLEAPIADALAPVSRAMLSHPAQWQARLHQIAFRVHGRETRLRSTPIGTEPGYGGNIVAYPPPRQIRRSLRMIAEAVACRPDAASSEIAAYVMLACTTVHPFLDGNGRTARILFNLVLRSEWPRLPYVAVKEITQFSAGDFLIAMNRVHYRQDWQPYFRWIEAILDVHLAIGTQSANAAA